jgi:hypothetical protein
VVNPGVDPRAAGKNDPSTWHEASVDEVDGSGARWDDDNGFEPDLDDGTSDSLARTPGVFTARRNGGRTRAGDGSHDRTRP